jgi:hypothetical protein
MVGIKLWNDDLEWVVLELHGFEEKIIKKCLDLVLFEQNCCKGDDPGPASLYPIYVRAR